MSYLYSMWHWLAHMFAAGGLTGAGGAKDLVLMPGALAGVADGGYLTELLLLSLSSFILQGLPFHRAPHPQVDSSGPPYLNMERKPVVAMRGGEWAQ